MKLFLNSSFSFKDKTKTSHKFAAGHTSIPKKKKKRLALKFTIDIITFMGNWVSNKSNKR